MPGFVPGPPYHFWCRKCGHRFWRKFKLALWCPKCHSLQVIEDPFLRK